MSVDSFFMRLRCFSSSHMAAKPGHDPKDPIWQILNPKWFQKYRNNIGPEGASYKY